ncbi:hypothetical protein V492_01743 [Pseudogymnoascus sp. VKM F-4246]|nr:hypothetical protein V492_01743 [Pseudogymnoascus sp. VKM F-4246]
MQVSSGKDENRTKTTDIGEKRRMQNRVAQRNYRNNIKQRLRQLDQLDEAFSKCSSINTGTLSRGGSNEDEVLHQQHHTTVYPISQPLASRPDNNCSWPCSQNEISVAGHAEIQMDFTSEMEPNQYIFDSNSPYANRAASPRSQHQQYSYFDNPSSLQEQHAILTSDHKSSGQEMSFPSRTQAQYQNHHASTETKPDAATQSSFDVDLTPAPNVHSQRQNYGMQTPPDSEKGSAWPRLRSNTANSITAPQYSATAASGTPLHQAAANGHLQIVRFLILKGANVTAPNEAGQTVLHLAAEQGHEDVIEHVLSQDEGIDAKAFINWVDNKGFTALHRAAAVGHEECVRILVEGGAEIESSASYQSQTV